MDHELLCQGGKAIKMKGVGVASLSTSANTKPPLQRLLG